MTTNSPKSFFQRLATTKLTTVMGILGLEASPAPDQAAPPQRPYSARGTVASANGKMIANGRLTSRGFKPAFTPSGIPPHIAALVKRLDRKP